MTPPTSRDGAAPEATPRAYNALHQELIEARRRLDRQVSQLVRLNALSRQLLHHDHERPLADSFAEAILDVLDVGFGAVWVLDEDPNPRAPRFAVFGARVPQESWLEIGPRLRDLLPASGHAVSLDDGLVAELLPGLALHDVQACRCVTRDGTTAALLLAANTAVTVGMDEPPGEESRQVLTLLAEKCAEHLDTSRDWRTITGQVDQLRESEERLDLVLRGTNDGWWDWDIVRGTCMVSGRWNAMLGEPDSESTVHPGFWDDAVHEADRPAFLWMLDEALAGDSTGIETEVRLRRTDETYLPVLVRGTIARDDAGRPIRFAGSILDLTERKRHEAHVHQLAFFDSLTELPNRRLLQDRLQQSLRANRRTGLTSAVLMIDLDRFKALNDTHGHAAGDQLLRGVARRLKDSVREHDTVARLGGDEFVVLLERLDSDPAAARTTVEALAAKVLDTLGQPYNLEVGVKRHGASIGVALADADDVTADTLLKRADVAMYEAKGAGRNRVHVFHPDMQNRVDTRTAVEARLREAFAGGMLQMMYQAQVDAQGVLCGAEALMRWHPDEGEPVPPAVFIPIAEESGLIQELGQWSLDAVCRQVVLWRPHLPEGFRVSVNVSASEFMNPEFTSRVVDTLERTGARGTEIRLEITEANVVTELKFAADRMNMLRSHGLEFSLDDFGTGYSSLTYLRQLPVSEVKIDRSYVRRFLNDRHDEAILKAILALCASLDIRVVAEGVETPAQWEGLLRDGCPLFQGYLFGRALPPTAKVADLTRESLTAVTYDSGEGREPSEPS